MTKKKPEDALRDRLQKKLNWAPARFEVIWQRLVNDRSVEDYFESGDEDLDVLVSQARELRKLGDEVSQADRRRGRTATPARKPQLLPGDLHRSQAFSDYLAFLADRDGDVLEFRAVCLGGSFLTEEEARSVHGSRALAILAPDELTHLGLSARSQEVWGNRTSLTLGLNRGKCILPPATLSYNNVPEYWRTVVLARLGEEPLSVGFLPIADPRRAPFDAWAYVWEGSVLDEARKLSESLAKRYPWSPGQAAWFLLTGVRPFVSPLAESGQEALGWGRDREGNVSEAPTYIRDTTTFTVDSWIDPDTLARQLRLIQQSRTRKDSRALAPRTLNLFQFVVRLRRESKTDLSWEQIRVKWNEMQGQGSHRITTTSAIRLAFDRALRVIAFSSRKHMSISTLKKPPARRSRPRDLPKRK